MRQSVRSAPIQKRPGRPTKGGQRNSMGLSANVRAGLDIMVAEGLKRSDAAARVGISDSALYQALRKPEVATYYNQQLALLRTSEAARNTHALLTIRDRAMEQEASAAYARAGVEAVKVLEADRQGPSGPVVNVNVAPGWVIDCSAALARGPHMIDVTPEAAP